MKYYDIISVGNIIFRHSCDGRDTKDAVNVLQANIEDPRFQWVFQPLEVIRYKKGGLRGKTPPFQYHLTGMNNSVLRFCVIKKLGLAFVRAHIDTTFNDDGPDKTSPFPRNWRPNLGYPTVYYKKLHAQWVKRERERVARQNRIWAWTDLLVKKDIIKRPKKRVAKVAVILTSYNRPTLVQKAIRSVMSQTYQNFTLYIVDNNSNLKVKTILRRYKSQYPNKIVLHFLNTPDRMRLRKCWLSHMINWALRKGREPYIALLTDDCWFTPNRLGAMVKYLDDHPPVEFIYGTQHVVDKRGRVRERRVAHRIIPPRGGAGILDHNQVMFRRTVIHKCGYWDESARVIIAPDAEFFSRTPAKYPIKVLTDYNLDHPRRFQNYLKRKRADLLTRPQIME